MKRNFDVPEHIATVRRFITDLKTDGRIVQTRTSRRSAVRSGRRRLRMNRVIGLGALAAFGVSVATVHASQVLHESGRSAIAAQLTRAIAMRDAQGVKAIFVPTLGDEVVHDLRLGELADRFAELGNLRGVRVEQAGSGRTPWVMVALFTHGSQVERIRFIGDRIVAFSASSTEMQTAQTETHVQIAAPTQIATEDSPTQ
jgi:hypothetical protein